MPRLNNNNWNSYSNRYSTSTYNNEREFFNTYHLLQSPEQVEIDVYLTGRQNSLLESCMQLSQRPASGDRELVIGNLIYDFEEEELEDLEDFSGDPSNPLRAALQEIADALQINIHVFVGHIDICQDYLTPYESRLPMLTKPTIVLLIGCLGSEYAKEANQKEIWMNSQAVVMAFEDLVHIYDFEIYGCKQSHVSIQNMSCEYDGVKEDYKELVDRYGRRNQELLDDYDLHRASHDATNKLVECCNAKINRFRSIFLKKLRERGCAKFTKDRLQAKMAALLKEDGSLDRDKIENPASYIFSYADGLECNTEDCAISNPYEGSEERAKIFNDRSELFRLYEEIQNLSENNGPIKENDAEVLKKLKSLSESKKKIFTYIGLNGSLLCVLAWNGCVESVEYILKQKIDLPLYSKDRWQGTFVDNLLKSGNTSEENCYRIIVKILEKYPDFFTNDNSPICSVLAHACEIGFYSIIQLLSYKISEDFAYCVHLDNNYNLLFSTFRILPWSTEKAYKIVKLLLAKGANPNHKLNEEDDIFTYYFKQHVPLVKEKILRELCNYGYSNINAINALIEEYSKILTSPRAEIAYKDTLIKYVHKLPSVENWNSNNLGDEFKSSYEEVHTTYELFLQSFRPSIQNLLRLLEDCKRIINKGGKKNYQLNFNKKKTLKNVKQNVNNITRRVLAPDKIHIAYQDIDEYIKKVGAKFTKEEKKAYRDRGIKIIQNKNQNAVERLQTLESILKEIMEEAEKRMKGGKRYRVTHKKKKRN
jgi:hypothetical protein